MDVTGDKATAARSIHMQGEGQEMIPSSTQKRLLFNGEGEGWDTILSPLTKKQCYGGKGEEEGEGWEMNPSSNDMQSFLDQFPTAYSTNNKLNNKKKEKLHCSNGMTCFLSNDEFDYMVSSKLAAEDAFGWKALPENIVFRIEKMTPIQTKWGSRCIIQLCNSMGEDMNVWAPSNVVRDLKSGYKLNGKNCIAFIKSLGQKETNVIGETKKKFFDFETVYLPL